ncbi:MAG: anti-sigma factor [Acidimicrobiales bacterium]
MGHDQLAELMGAYALDALDTSEADQVRTHLVDCPRCALEVQQNQAIAGLLANSGDNAPTYLWDRIASQIDRPTDVEQPRSLALTLAKPTAKQTDRRTRRSLKPPAYRAIRLAATAAAVVAIAALSVQIARLDQRVDALRSSNSQQAIPMAAQAALSDRSSRLVTLTAANTIGPVIAEIVLVPSGEAFLINERLDSLPSDQTYQLWGRTGNQVISLGLLGSDPADVPFRVDPTARIVTFAITAEHAGGVVMSTRVPVAVGSVA